MIVAVLGAGALGLLFAGRLAAAGAAVTLFPRTAEQETALHRGIAIEGLTALHTDSFRIERLRPDEENAGGAAATDRFDWVIVTVKQPQLTEELMARLAAWFKTDTRFLLLQNGMGHAERFAKHAGPERVAVAVTTEGALRISENTVRHTGQGETFIGPYGFGKEAAAMPFEDVDRLLDALRQAGFNCSASSEMQQRMWEKLLINAVINPLTAILRIPNGELPAAPDRLSLMRRLYDEARPVAIAAGTAVDPGLWERILEVCRRTATNRSSMLQDVEAGRETEIEAITGSLLDSAHRHGLELPTHRTLYALIRSMNAPISECTSKRHMEVDRQGRP